MEIEIRGIPGDAPLQAHVTRQLAATVENLRPRPMAAEVGFGDENGPKGGIAIRCALTLRLPRRPALHVDHLAETSRLAFDGGLDRLSRQLGRDRGRERERRRRPKKYYLAKRLREGEGGAPGAPEARAS